MQNGTATLEDSLVVSYRTKYILIIQSGSHTLWYLLKGVKTWVYTKNNTQMFIAAVFIMPKLGSHQDVLQ